MQTGAFEVYVDGNLIYSKLQTKRMPSMDELIYVLSEAGISLK